MGWAKDPQPRIRFLSHWDIRTSPESSGQLRQSPGGLRRVTESFRLVHRCSIGNVGASHTSALGPTLTLSCSKHGRAPSPRSPPPIRHASHSPRLPEPRPPQRTSSHLNECPSQVVTNNSRNRRIHRLCPCCVGLNHVKNENSTSF